MHKSYILSVAGLTLEENIRIFKSIGESPKKVCGIELNMSCPNVQGKAQVGYDLEAMDKYLARPEYLFYLRALPTPTFPLVSNCPLILILLILIRQQVC